MTTVIRPPTPHGQTIFCDDIRYETSGKVTLVGIYMANLLVSKLPAKLPQFHLRVMYSERPNESTDPVELRIFLPGKADNEPIVKSLLPMDELRKNAPGAEERLKADPAAVAVGLDHISITALMDVKLSPMELLQEGFIRVRAYRGDEEIRLGSLEVRVIASQALLTDVQADAPRPSS